MKDHPPASLRLAPGLHARSAAALASPSVILPPCRRSSHAVLPSCHPTSPRLVGLLLVPLAVSAGPAECGPPLGQCRLLQPRQPLGRGPGRSTPSPCTTGCTTGRSRSRRPRSSC